MEEFHRIQRLPPYIFSITDALKKDARARGEDIVDFGMGNPDQATPSHIVDKLTETVSEAILTVIRSRKVFPDFVALSVGGISSATACN